ncbi:PASTA domain containing protein [Thermomonospora curvata DSM 43183]|uniref:PASTA domain containing protein n=1 Tax=Thermomonospora curvata (strain ATCC 19995 / DSM 43183 / JCM 3096 / KCTC 9072 / NBRC 15933 / NCIMB 10081 / Henssen B9) TaxID=471852 RepID=D1AA55_THECD|nr:PASTA domain containing protein [Thermomonospora curvata DSM 43183]PKK14874.1 MAG: PASTA domain-containing protein [Thermomonospora sp. CIF 1]
MHAQPPSSTPRPPLGQPGYPQLGVPPKRSATITVRRGVAVFALGLTAFVSCGIGGAVTAGDTQQAGSASGASAEPKPRVTVTVTKTVTAAPQKDGAGSARPAAGDEDDRVELPDVVGKNGAIARDILERAGFKNIDYSSADPNGASVVLLPVNWRVVKQEPAAGKKVDPTALVVLTVVKASS